jgi:hypothetical protein
MKQNSFSFTLRLSGIVIMLALFVVPNIILSVKAQPTYSSPSYGVDQVFFGSGGVNDANSANYNARASLGDTGVGNSSSSLYQLYGGFTTTEEPFLEFVVNPANVNLGTLSTGSASTGSATFTVRSYLSSGYVVRTASDPPQNGSYTMAGMPATAASNPGTEQFGINLRANTAPATVGADPEQIPDASFSFGQAAVGYNTVNQYKYVKGDSIAFSSQSSGVTEYTMTYMINISSLTPGGIYVMNHNLVATATF